MKNDFEMLEKKVENFLKKLKEGQQLKNWECKFPLTSSNAYLLPPGTWLKNRITIPEEIMGIKIKDSRVHLQLLFPRGGEIFVNGKSIEKKESWFDLDFALTKSANPGERFTVAIKAGKGKGLAYIWKSQLFIQVIENVIFQLETLFNEFKLVRNLLKWNSEVRKKYSSLLSAVLTQLKIELLEERKIKEFISSFEQAMKTLSPLSREVKKFTIHLIGHAHLDMNWLWTWPATLIAAKGTIQSVNSLMKEYPDFHFSQSQATLYSTMEKNHPSLFKKMKEWVKQGRWDITASTWVEGDLNMASGESLVRQILYAKKYIREKFGIEPRICWSPDTFGHPWTYPQILKKSGIDYYYGFRCRPSSYPLFWWEAPDGSRVIAFNSGETYNNSIGPGLCSELIQTKERSGSNHHLIVYGIGNHGGGPTRRDLDTAAKLQKRSLFPNLKFNKAENFFKAATASSDYPVVRDELNPIFEGCYTTHSDIKLMNRRAETLLSAAETFSTIASFYGLSYPGEELETAWRNTCFNQFHDLLDGSAIHPAYEYSHRLFKKTEKICQSHLDKALQSISKEVSVQKNQGIPIIVFNPLSWQRKDIVKVKVPSLKSGEFSLCDEKGNFVPCQLNRSTLIFIGDVPSLGYRTYCLLPCKSKNSPKFDSLAIVEKDLFYKIENEFFTVLIDKNSGCIAYLFDKRTKKELITADDTRKPAGAEPSSSYPPGNLFQILFEKPHPMSAWNIGPISKTVNLISGAKVKIVEKGPVRIVIKVEHKFNQSSILQEIILYRELPRIDFFTTVNWQEKGTKDSDGPMLKVSFPLNISNRQSCFEIPFGYIYRSNNGREVPALKWADLSQKEYGVSLLNDCKYGYEVMGSQIKLTLLRSPYEPDPAPDVGINRFCYSLLPHSGDWRKGRTVNYASEINSPLILYLVKNPNPKGMLPSPSSFLQIEPANLIISAFKKAEKGKGLIVRIYESQGKETRGKLTLNLPVSSVKETDLMEKSLKKLKISQGKISLPFSHNEIKTLLLK